MFFLKKTVAERPVSHYQLATTYYLIVLVHATLERLGFFDALREKKGGVKIKELSKLMGVRADLLETCVDFLWSTTDYLEKTEQGVVLKNNAPTWFWMASYKPVFDNLEHLLRGAKKYGKDVVRDGYYLQNLSVVAGKPVEDYIVRQLQDVKEKSAFVDLGCGPATLLIRANTANPLLQCIGIDVDPVIIEAARKNVMRSQYPINIITADVLEIDLWKKHIPLGTNLIFSANTILHELLRNGEENFISFLKKFKETFTGAHFFAAEVDALSYEEIRRREQDDYKLFMAMYMLIHPLTDQGLPRPKKEWLSFFEKSGWHVTSAEKPREGDTRIMYDCQL